jgi:hypothetical protein
MPIWLGHGVPRYLSKNYSGCVCKDFFLMRWTYKSLDWVECIWLPNLSLGWNWNTDYSWVLSLLAFVLELIVLTFVWIQAETTPLALLDLQVSNSQDLSASIIACAKFFLKISLSLSLSLSHTISHICTIKTMYLCRNIVRMKLIDLCI